MEKIFQKRISEFEKLLQESKDRSLHYSWTRLFVFLLSAVIIISVIKIKLVVLAFLLFTLFIIGFSLVVKTHNKIKYKIEYYENLILINKDEIKRLDLELRDFDSGNEYLNESHPFAYDLDVFGQHSLFQLISRTTTVNGRDSLALDLSTHRKPEEIFEKQRTINELKDDLEWRQNIQALGLTNVRPDKSALESFFTWLKKDKKIKHLSLLNAIAYISWPFLIVVSFLILAKQISFWWILIFLFLASILILPNSKHIKDLTNGLSKIQKQLSAIYQIILAIEKRKFESSVLQEIQTRLINEKYKASSRIKSLSTLVDMLQNRGNMYYHILNSFFMFDLIFLYQAEKWRKQNKDHINIWLNAIGDFEVILSYCGFAYSNPAFQFPKILNDQPMIEAENAGHPLIHPSKRIDNDFKMVGKGTVSLITGSNMAGKSTFLRTIGLNLVLAQCGAPVCASRFVFHPCQVFSSMRTKDNLEESVSTFYAELLRIRSLLNSLNDQGITFYLLDEILKGTNSHDRHLGALNLIRQLNRSNAMGLVSTHDIELNDLSKDIDNFENYHFQSEMSGNEINFDYKLKKGPCTSFNAIELMKKMGITIE